MGAAALLCRGRDMLRALRELSAMEEALDRARELDRDRPILDALELERECRRTIVESNVPSSSSSSVPPDDIMFSCDQKAPLGSSA